MQTNAVAYPAEAPRGRKADREELSVAETIVGWRGSLRGILSQVQAVAPTNTTVLLAGETGTGKEVIARAIHELSPRRGRNLVLQDEAPWHGAASRPSAGLNSGFPERNGLHASERPGQRRVGRSAPLAHRETALVPRDDIPTSNTCASS